MAVPLELLSETTSFRIEFHRASALAQQEASALAATCESDCARLRELMGVPPASYGPGGRIRLVVEPLSDGVGGTNGGYDPGGTEIFVTELPGATDEMVRAIFVAELVEVFNDQLERAGQGGWHAATSFSEGISLALTRELRRAGYRGVVSTPRVNRWLATARADLLETAATGELEGVANGCALLFLHYLRHQLHHDWSAILHQPGAETLAASGAALAGAQGTFAAFKGLVDRHIPPGAQLSTENPFPLLEPAQRTAALTFEEVPIGAPRTLPGGRAHVRPYLGCEAKDYRYDVVEQDVRLRGVATWYGLVLPEATWTVNGHEVSFSGWPLQSFTVEASVANEDPQQPDRVVYSDQPVTLRPDLDVGGVLDPDTASSAIALDSVGNPGRIVVEVGVRGREGHETGPLTSTTAVAWLETRRLRWEAAFWEDREACRRRMHEALDSLVHWKDIPIWKTLPDPPESWREAIRWLSAVHGALARVEARDPASAAQMAEAIAFELGVGPELLGRWARR